MPSQPSKSASGSVLRQVKEALLALKTKIWAPQPGKQQEAYDCEADELFYGGAAGGGKSDLLLGLAINRHHQATIFRRELVQLAALVTRSKELLRRERASWNGHDFVWKWPGGKELLFSGVKEEDDVWKHQGRPKDLLGFDELPHFSQRQYQILCAWARTTRRGQRVRIVATGNPPTSPEGEWVIDYWGPWLDPRHPRPAKSGEIRWYANVNGVSREVPDGSPITREDGQVILPTSRTFIQARLEDNPILASTGYAARIDALPEPMRTAFREGVFALGLEDRPYQVIPTRWVLEAQARWELSPMPEADRLNVDCWGVDIALGGDDYTVFTPRIGGWFGEAVKYPGSDTATPDAVVALIEQALENGGYANFDVVGVGGQVWKRIKEKRVDRRATWPVNFGERPRPNDGLPLRDSSGVLTFANVRAAAYWALREALSPDSERLIALPPGREVVADLTAPVYMQQGGGRLILEPKEDISARLGRSPDVGDSIVLANWTDPRRLLAIARARRRENPRIEVKYGGGRAVSRSRREVRFR